MRVTEFRKLLLGSWALHSYRAEPVEPGLVTIYPYTKNATGIIMYTHDGYVSAQIMAPLELPPVTPEEPALEETFFAYTGPFTLTEGNDNKPNLTHSMQVSNTAWLGQTQIRVVTINGDLLRLMGTGPANFSGTMRNSILEWKRIVPYTKLQDKCLQPKNSKKHPH